MARIEEFVKGITLSLVAGLLYYFYWDNIFLNLMNWIGTFTISGVTESNSLAILTALAWISFIILYVTTFPLYFIYSIANGAKGSNTTYPLDILKGIGIYILTLPVGVIIYSIVSVLINSVENATSSLMSSETLATANQISWLIALLVILIINAVPYYYIIKGYGQLNKNDQIM